MVGLTQCGPGERHLHPGYRAATRRRAGTFSSQMSEADNICMHGARFANVCETSQHLALFSAFPSTCCENHVAVQSGAVAGACL